LADVYNMRCQAARMEHAGQQALIHARTAGTAPQEARALEFLAAAVFTGPTPASVALQRLDDISKEAKGYRKTEALLFLARGWCEAMIGKSESAMESMATSQSILLDLGLTNWIAAASMWRADIYLAADDASSAERELQDGYQTLSMLGEKSFLSTLAGKLARLMAEQGRDKEAEDFSDLSREAAASQDIYSQILWRSARAIVLARQNASEEALRLAQQSVGLAEQTDSLTFRADAFRGLAEVLRFAGRLGEARAAITEAIQLLERKGDTTSLTKARAALERVAPTQPGIAPSC
jgi:tetratricopeptide (TPR) repeat protein